MLTTVYLLFNEGYSATGGVDPLRRSLTSEALRLAALLYELLPDEVGVVGLRALMLLRDARRAARLDAAGDLVRLADQDRSLWDRDAIREGMALLGIALRRPVPTPDPYVAQAAIAACHVLAPTWHETSWAAIVSWYDALLTSMDTPVVARAEFLSRLGRTEEARAAFRDAIALPGNNATKRELARRVDELAQDGTGDAAKSEEAV